MSKKKKSKLMQGTPALLVLEEAGVSFEVFKYEVHTHADEGFALDAAHQLGLDPRILYKTLVTVSDQGEAFFAIVPADHTLSLKRLAKAAGVKRLQMAERHRAEHLTGYVAGGISALGSRTQLPVFIAEEASGLDQILVSGGARGLSVGISPTVLAELTGAVFAEIAS